MGDRAELRCSYGTLGLHGRGRTHEARGHKKAEAAKVVTSFVTAE